MELGRRLAQCDDEASLRTAVGRVYYSIFHQVRDGLRACKRLQDNRLEGSHDRVWNSIKPGQTGLEREWVQVYTLGTRLKDWRVKADYEKTESLDWRPLAKCAIDTADNLHTNVLPAALAKSRK